MLENILSKWQKWILPYRCCLCRLESDRVLDLCSVCATLLPWVEDRCYRCGLRLEGLNDPIFCKVCQENPPIYDRLATMFDYTPPVTHLIMGLKFSGQLAFGRLLGELFAEKVINEWYKNDTLPEAFLPVPLHSRRIRSRGYNQSMELLWPLKKQLDIPILTNVCERIRHTKPQSHLKKEFRPRNVKNAFAFTNRKILRKISHIAIVDDVVTTGSTVSALSLLLKNAGVMRVDILCVCRG